MQQLQGFTDLLFNLLAASVGVVTVVIATRGFLATRRKDEEKDATLRELDRMQGGLPEDVDKEFELLKRYHDISLTQSRASHWFSLLFASLGFFVIVMPVIRNVQEVQLLPLVSGAVIEAVASLFFVQSNRATRLMVDSFDRLRTDRKLEKALDLAQEIRDPDVQSRLKALLALDFAGVHSAGGEGVLAAILQQDGFLAAMLNMQERVGKEGFALGGGVTPASRPVEQSDGSDSSRARASAAANEKERAPSRSQQ